MAAKYVQLFDEVITEAFVRTALTLVLLLSYEEESVLIACCTL